ncbi:MAG: putative DNA binding domain-containing protein [Anaerolineae bacterium]|nr:putative DNA binding domain-containing protein [Anaerolineae bacterium]
MTAAEADAVRPALSPIQDQTEAWMPTAVDLTAIAETLMAFANTRQGGTLVIGIGEGGKVEGVDEAVPVMDRVLQASLSLTPSLIIPLPRVTDVDGRRVVTVTVPAGMAHVYSFGGRYLTREGTYNVPLQPVALRRLLIERGEVTFEAEPAYGLTRDALDWERAQQYASTIGERDAEQALLQRGCIVRMGEQLCPTHAGVLLFGRDPRRTLRGSEITAVRFAGTVMGDTFTRQDIIGTLPDQIKRAETFLRDHLRKGVQLRDSMARTEQYEYPLEAVRELVVNAVAHRDYSIHGDGIRLYLFADRLEITSPGRLPGPVTVANIRDERFSRNPALVQVLADMGYIERLGYGVDRVLELTRQHGLREPVFNETSGGFKVTVFNTPAPVVIPAAKPTSHESVVVEAAAVAAALPDQPVTGLRAVYRHLPLNPRQESVLDYLSEAGNTRITNSELQRMHPDVHPETIRRDLSDLVSKDVLAKMGEKRGSYYVVRRHDGD